jgi:hypothetical protein
MIDRVMRGITAVTAPVGRDGRGGRRERMRPENAGGFVSAQIRLASRHVRKWRPHGESNPALKIENLLS